MPLPRLWPLNLVLVLLGIRAIRHWFRAHQASIAANAPPELLKLQSWRLTAVLSSFGLLLVVGTAWLLLGLPDWVAAMGGIAIAACMVVACVVSAMLGWKFGAGS